MIQGHIGDSRGVLQRWCDGIVAGGRCARWLVEFNPGGDHPAAGSSVSFVRDDVAA